MNLDYATVFSLAPFINEDIIVLIGICLLIGAMAKSSQLGLQERTSMPKRVNNVEFTLYSTLLIAGNFSNAWESVAYFNLRSLILHYTKIYIRIVRFYRKVLILFLCASASCSLVTLLKKTVKVILMMNTLLWILKYLNR